jgi:hypothetical protein
VETTSQLSVRPPKRDRSTLPTVAFIVSCVLFTYGYKEGNTLIQWIIPGILMISSIAWSLWSTRGGGESGTPS